MAGYTAEELITKRSEVSNQIQTTLVEKISDRGFSVVEFNVTNIDFSEEYDQAIEAKAVKQQEVVAAQAELEKQKILNEKEISIAEKDAKVMELQNSQITENTLKLRRIETLQAFVDKWDGKLPSTMLSEGLDAILNLNY
jgi:regulator of protease activity HflC (stomatin/prohibitin superfamily)